MTTYEINNEHNGIEIRFDSKPGEIIRAELKNNGFRWHKVKKVWYAKQTPERVKLAEQITAGAENLAHPEPNNDPKPELIDPQTRFVDGGGLYDGWEGGKSRTWKTDKELKDMIRADLKRAGIRATVKSNRSGFLTSITLTLTIEESDIKTFADWQKDYNYYRGYWHYYTDDEGRMQSVHRDTEVSDEIKEKIIKTEYELAVKNLLNSSCFGGESEILSESGNRKLDAAHRIVTAYNRDCSNTMIDYFDRDIYDHYAFKIA